MAQEFTLDELNAMEDKEYSLEELEAMENAPSSEKMGTPLESLAKVKARIADTEAYQSIAPYVEPVASALGTGAGYVGDVINYLDAPMREAAMAPKRVYEGDVQGALLEPLLQFTESGSQAPAWKDVAQAYGVPKEIEIKAPYSTEEIMKMARGEQIPERKVGIPVAEDIGMITEMGLGGKGLGATIKAAKPVVKGTAIVGGKALDLATGSTMPSEVLKQTGQAIKTGAEELKTAAKEFSDPTMVNRQASFGKNEKNIVSEIFGDDVPSAIKYTPDSEIVRMEKVLADKAGGGSFVKKHNEGVGKIVDYLTNIPSKIAAKTRIGSPLPKREAGAFLIDSYNKKVKEIFNSIDFTRDSVVKQLMDDDFNVPALTQRSTTNISRIAKKLQNEVASLEVGVSNPVALQAKEIKAIAQDIEAMVTAPKGKSFAPGTIRDLHNKLTSIGKLAYEPNSPFNPVDKTRLKKLYSDLNKEFLGDVREYLGDQIADDLIANNKTMSNFFAASKPIDDVLSDLSTKQMPPEDAFRSIVEKGNSHELKAIQDILGSEEYNVLKSSYLNDKIQKNIKFIEEGSDVPPAVNWQTLENNLRKENSFNVLFDNDEQNAILAAISLGKRMGTPYASKSGTGLSVGAQNLRDRIFGMTQLERQKNVMEGKSMPMRGKAVGGVPRMLLQKQNVLQNIDPLEQGRQLMNEALMQGIPPFMIEDEIKRSPLKPTEKAQLRKAVPK